MRCKITSPFWLSCAVFLSIDNTKTAQPKPVVEMGIAQSVEHPTEKRTSAWKAKAQYWYRFDGFFGVCIDTRSYTWPKGICVQNPQPFAFVTAHDRRGLSSAGVPASFSASQWNWAITTRGQENQTGQQGVMGTTHRQNVEALWK